MVLNTLDDVLADQIGDLLSAERQLIEALPKLAKAADSDELQTAFSEHLEQTRGHVKRLEEIKQIIQTPVPPQHCEGMEGLIREGDEIVTSGSPSAARDAALIAAAQRVEHYEIAAYGTARTLADQLNIGEATRLLDSTLDEESKADKLLTKIATGPMFRSGLNAKAAARAR
jgi:ferritin-like metal-binding protein YciE